MLLRKVCHQCHNYRTPWTTWNPSAGDNPLVEKFMKSPWIFLLLFAASAIHVNAATIDWDKVYRADRDELDRVAAIQRAAATNCTGTVEYAIQFVEVVPDCVAYVGGFW